MSRANLPASPPTFTNDPNWHGLTIREEFAKAAMAAIIANGRTARGGSASIVADVVAEAREYADALIDELEQEPRK